MKEKTTRKYIKEVYGTPIMLPQYCEIPTLLTYHNPDYYCTRAEGWACDIYYLVGYNKTISMGYAPFGIKPKNPDYVYNMEQKAKTYLQDHRYDADQEKVKDHIEKLLAECLENMEF